jgi:hypothetical protein
LSEIAFKKEIKRSGDDEGHCACRRASMPAVAEYHTADTRVRSA